MSDTRQDDSGDRGIRRFLKGLGPGLVTGAAELHLEDAAWAD